MSVRRRMLPIWSAVPTLFLATLAGAQDLPVPAPAPAPARPLAPAPIVPRVVEPTVRMIPKHFPPGTARIQQGLLNLRYTPTPTQRGADGRLEWGGLPAAPDPEATDAAAIDLYRVQVEHLRQRLRVARAELEATHAALRAARAEVETGQAKLQAELHTTRKRLEASEAQAEQARAELRALRREMLRAQSGTGGEARDAQPPEGQPPAGRPVPDGATGEPR